MKRSRIGDNERSGAPRTKGMKLSVYIEDNGRIGEVSRRSEAM